MLTWTLESSDKPFNIQSLTTIEENWTGVKNAKTNISHLWITPYGAYWETPNTFLFDCNSFHFCVLTEFCKLLKVVTPTLVMQQRF